MNNKNAFIENPVSLDISRSKFNLNTRTATTLSAGELVPVLNYELVQPGDTFKVNVSALIRSTTPISPTMDDCYMDICFFFCAHKNLLSRETMSNATGAISASHSFNAWLGAQDSLLNVGYPTKVALPLAMFDEDDRAIGSLGDHLGYPLGEQNTDYLFVTPWSKMAYYSVWNNYYRDPNTMNPVTYQVNADSNSDTGYTCDFILPTGLDSVNCLYGCRKHGYFGSALPWPQRNSTSVELPLGQRADIIAVNESGAIRSPSENKFAIVTPGSWPVNASRTLTIGTSGTGTASGNLPVYADLSTATAATVNEVRYAFQLQKMYEKLARGGNRLQEMTKALFNVTPHDYLDDVPEFLGGKSIQIQNHLVANTAGTTLSTETQMSIGSTGAFSLTNDRDYYFTKSFDTWGTLLCVVIIRPRESFSQGLDRQATKFDPLQLYTPVMANIGEQPIYKKELFCDGSTTDNEVFGYQEAWAEYRMIPDKVTGQLRGGQNMSYWTYVNNFATAPTLKGYLDGSQLYKNIDQTLQVKKQAAGFQYMIQLAFNIEAVRAMPTYSIPGLIDHH